MTIILEALLVGGVTYTGIKTFNKRRKRKKFLDLVDQHNTQVTGLSVSNEDDRSQVEKKVNRDFALSSISLGLSVTGSLIYPPFGIISVPLTVYGAFPIFENAYDVVFNQGRSKLAIVNSVIIIGSLVTNHFFLASLFQWGYHVNTKLLLEIDHTYRQLLAHLFGNKSRSIWVVVAGVEVQIPREELKIGDIVVVNEDEIIPVDGIVTDGTAIVDMYIITGEARPAEIKPGDQVLTASFVLSGRICIQAKKV